VRPSDDNSAAILWQNRPLHFLWQNRPLRVVVAERHRQSVIYAVESVLHFLWQNRPLRVVVAERHRQSVIYAVESVLHSALCVAALFCPDCSRHETRRLLLVCHCDSLLASESEKDLYQLEAELVSEALLSVLLFLLSFGTMAQARS
jgi:hypothetical protein